MDFLAEDESDLDFVFREEKIDSSVMRPFLTAMGLGVLASWTAIGASCESTAGVALESSTGLAFGEKKEVIDLNPGCAIEDELLLDAVFAFGFPIFAFCFARKQGGPWSCVRVCRKKLEKLMN